MRNLQLNKHGELQHLLTIEGLPRATLTAILDTATPFTEVAEREVKKLPRKAQEMAMVATGIKELSSTALVAEVYCRAM